MKIELLRAFWNDEGSISANGRLSADSRSKKIIDQLISIHKQFGLNLNKTKYFVSRKPMYKIYLSKTKENTAKFIRLGLFTFSIVGRGQNKGKLKIAVTKEALNKF